MNKIYQIQKLDSSEFTYVVIAKDYHRIDDYIVDAGNELRLKNFSGAVLFDCLFNNGLKDRFYVAYFNGRAFDLRSFKSLEKVDNNVTINLNRVYLKNINWLENNTILSNAQKFLFKKKLGNTVSSKVLH